MHDGLDNNRVKTAVPTSVEKDIYISLEFPRSLRLSSAPDEKEKVQDWETLSDKHKKTKHPKKTKKKKSAINGKTLKSDSDGEAARRREAGRQRQ